MRNDHQAIKRRRNYKFNTHKKRVDSMCDKNLLMDTRKIKSRNKRYHQSFAP